MKAKSKNDSYSEWSNKKLMKTRDLLKGLLIGAGIVLAVVLGVLVYVFSAKPDANISLVSFIPAFLLSVTLLPVFLILRNVNNELKSRHL